MEQTEVKKIAPSSIITCGNPLSSPQVSSILRPQARIFLFLFIFLVFCNHAILSCRLSSHRSHPAPQASKSTSPYCFFHPQGFKRPKCIKGFYFMAHFRLLHRGLDISSLIKTWPKKEEAHFSELIAFFLSLFYTECIHTYIRTCKDITWVMSYRVFNYFERVFNNN